MLLSYGMVGHGTGLNSYGRKEVVSCERYFWETTGSLLGPFDVPFRASGPAQFGAESGSVSLCGVHTLDRPKA